MTGHILKKLAGHPFHLDDEALAWVQSTFDKLSLDEKLGQIVLPLCRDLSTESLSVPLSRRVGGVHRMPSRSEQELRASADFLQSRTAIPLLMTCDIEFSEKSSVAAGTPYPNQMTIAATGDPEQARRMGVVAGSEGGYLGFNISWTPVADLAVNFRSNVVNTRSFGSDVATVMAMTTAYQEGARSAGFASSIKHWPGDGLDDRDQHFATTHNTMSMEEWRDSFGKIYADAIAKGVQVVMSGHITLPAYTAELGSSARSPAHMPATLNFDLSTTLLRHELGFNGLVVSDATGMVGFNARGDRRDLVPLCIAAGCDILLFPDDLDEDLDYLKEGLENGALTQERVDEAVLRVLALKASMKLHQTGGHPPAEAVRSRLLGGAKRAAWSSAAAEAGITLVKDTQALLPLDLDRHKRILLAQLDSRMSPSGPLPQLQVADHLRDRGFEVTLYRKGDAIDPTAHDIGMYLMAEEGVSAKENLGPRWEELHGLFPHSMERLWAYLPTVYVSLGTPFLLYHMPECRTFVNGYAAVQPVQQALVKALLGEIPFAGTSPVDVTCGLAEVFFQRGCHDYSGG
ncbi:glycoside hydrolase family 3 domain protein [Rhizobium sp. CF080]|uniref:glycoside hydrolase family 3 protein n=1 Tax=Rhizobium sp. (strain CF080) TaxID=1144310 RepID=UPI00027178AA|nr:glycoside hydrolase family 3 N-terminal domain-containing protein [Rhizobium sp. CF080]EUB98225.1 glycoside hydrolase family 3 domain protein [Rhizobium sp. CF080]